MAEITAALVKELRDTSGAGMMDCKRALQENDGDIQASIDWLRAKGLGKAAKKADRIAAEGLVGIATAADGKSAAVVEVNAETDFLARNELFQNGVRNIANVALANDNVEAILAAKTADGDVVQDLLTNLIATIGENMVLRRAKRFSVDQGVVASYIHTATAPGLGRIGVLVALESAADQAALNDLGRKIAMHIAATSPLSLSSADLDPAAVDRERAIFTEQARESGKPDSVIEKMIEGRIRKFQEEVVLLMQKHVMFPDLTVQALVDQTGKELGSPIKVAGFERFALGEGIEKKTEDFAAEVAAAAAGQA